MIETNSQIMQVRRKINRYYKSSFEYLTNLTIVCAREVAEVTASCAVMQAPSMEIAQHPFTTLHVSILCWLLETGQKMPLVVQWLRICLPI